MKTFVLVGCGRIARRHADILKFADLNAELIGVCDIDNARAQNFANTYNVPAFSDMIVMLKDLKPDVTVVVTPSGLHYRHVIMAARYSRAIVVEKPMALRMEHAVEMNETCSKLGVPLYVIKQNRYNPPILKLKNHILKGNLGKICSASVRLRWCRDQSYFDQDNWRGTMELDGGVIANQAAHHLDLLQWLVGEVEEVFSFASTALVDIEAEDTCVVALKFSNGAIGTIEATNAARPKNDEGSISIVAEKGIFEVAGVAVDQLTKWTVNDSDKELRPLVNQTTNPPDVYGFGHKEFYKHLLSNKHELIELVTGQEGIKSLNLISAIYESLHSGQPIKLASKHTLSSLGKSK